MAGGRFCFVGIARGYAGRTKSGLSEAGRRTPRKARGENQARPAARLRGGFEGIAGISLWVREASDGSWSAAACLKVLLSKNHWDSR